MKACKADGLHPRNDGSNRKNPHGMALSVRAAHRVGLPASAGVPLGFRRDAYEREFIALPGFAVEAAAKRGRWAHDRSWNVFALAHFYRPAGGARSGRRCDRGGALGGIIGGAVGRGAGGASPAR